MSLALALPMVDVLWGNRFTDMSAEDHEIVPYGDPFIAPSLHSPRGRAYIGSIGTQSYLRVVEGLLLGTVFTIEAWVVPVKVPDDQPVDNDEKSATVLGSPGTQAFTDNFLSYRGAGTAAPQTFRFYRQRSAPGGELELNGITQCAPGQRHHVVVQSDGSEWRLYVNGNLEDAVSSSTGWANQGQGFQVGGSFNPGYPGFMSYWEGEIHELIVWRDEARYSENFTPSLLIHPGVTGAVFSGGSPIEADVVGRTETHQFAVWTGSDGEFSLPWPQTDVGPIDLFAVRRRGWRFRPSTEVLAGEIIRPLVPNGFVYRAESNGVLPGQEPEPWPTTGSFVLGTVQLSPRADSSDAAGRQVAPGATGVQLVLGSSGGVAGDPAEVTGIVRVQDADQNISPVSRTVLAVHSNGGEFRIFGSARSGANDGIYTVEGRAEAGGAVYLLALDERGQPFVPAATLNVDDVIHPTTPNGYVYRVVTGGKLPATEPDWWTTGQQQVGTATLEAREYLRPLAHGPVDVTLL